MTLTKRQYLGGAVFLFIFLCTLFFGLKPKGYRFINQVTPTAQGLSFTNIGMIYSEKTLGDLGCKGDITIAMMCTPGRTGRVLSRLCTIVDERGYKRFTIDQWMQGLEVSLWDIKGNRLSRTGIDAHLQRNARNLFAAGIKDGAVWVYSPNDKLVHTSGKKIPIDLTTCQLLIGFGPTGENPWRGTISRLAIGTYSPDTAAISSLFSYLNDTTLKNDSIFNYYPAQFNFSQSGTSPLITTTTKTDWPLCLPKFPRFFRYALPELIPKSISHPEGYLADMIINLFGFMPFGFCLLLFLLQFNCTPHRAVIFSIALSLLTSVFIETVQIFIPTRTSQLMDVILNTTGGFLGALTAKFFRSSLFSDHYKKHDVCKG